MSSSISLSVVIPTYCPETGQLERAIASVKAHLPDAEIIVVDDGSVPEVEVQDAAVILLRQENSGPSTARNYGATKARGDWLLFLDDDDELLPGVVELERLVEPGIGIVWGRHAIDNETNWSNGPYGLAIAGTSFVRRELFDAVGGYDAALHFGENTDLYIRLMDLAPTASTEAVVLCYHTSHKDPYRYSSKIVDSIEYVLRRGRSDLTRSRRAQMHGIAAVNASRNRQYLRAFRHALLSTGLSPRLRSFGRLALTLVGPLGRLWWHRSHNPSQLN